MDKLNDKEYNPLISSESETQTKAQSALATTKRKNNERNYVNKKHRGVERRILIGSRVSAKVQKLILNSKGLNYRRVRESLFRNAVSSVSTKKFHVKFDDEQSKELYSN